jgi:Divergent InlB B-repeat domain
LLTGTLTQIVTNGSNGTAVTAVANSGYYFTNWTDGVTANPRTDRGVTNNLTVAANFVATNQSGAILTPLIISASMATNGTSFNLACTGSASQAYVLLSASNLTSAAWMPVRTNTADNSGQCSFTDLRVTNVGQRFYRIAKP